VILLLNLRKVFVHKSFYDLIPASAVSNISDFTMNFDDWTADLAANSATHSSGFTIRIEGNPKDPSDVYPGKFPEGISFIDQTRLLRNGLEFLAKSTVTKPSIPTPAQEAIKAREELTKLFADRSDKPQRAKLSLKKKTEKTD